MTPTEIAGQLDLFDLFSQPPEPQAAPEPLPKLALVGPVTGLHYPQATLFEITAYIMSRARQAMDEHFAACNAYYAVHPSGLLWEREPLPADHPAHKLHARTDQTSVTFIECRKHKEMLHWCLGQKVEGFVEDYVPIMEAYGLAPVHEELLQARKKNHQ